LVGNSHWATPGGGLDEEETFHAAAIRELREETGIQISTVAEPVAARKLELMLPSGETVIAVEQYFVVSKTQPFPALDGQRMRER
jgi:8-oxo-dGTP pyrophosphatase MutT (NUDIX family)